MAIFYSSFLLWQHSIHLFYYGYGNEQINSSLYMMGIKQFFYLIEQVMKINFSLLNRQSNLFLYFYLVIKLFQVALIMNLQAKSLPIYFFGIRILIHPSQHKRAFLVISQSHQNQAKYDLTPYSQVQNQTNQQENCQNYSTTQTTKKLPLKRIQKGWIWYKQIIDFQLTHYQSTPIIHLSLYSFDFNSCSSTYICGYKGKLYIDFSTDSQVKFTELQMIDEVAGSDQCVANVEFRYCEKNEHNLTQAGAMSSSSYLENSFSPAQFVYDNRSFVSNAAIVKTRMNQSVDLSRIQSPKQSSPLNLNKLNRNVFVKSKFHSVFSSNRGIPMDRQERFPSTKKKLTDQLAYYAHKTLDINELPTRENYRYSSFGKDDKECLKVNAFSQVGPGAGRYRLPSIFDKY